MKKNLKKGFTLIELLVVIAIIGILASVILASLDSARAKGVDAATKADLDNSRAQAELFYDSGGVSANTYLNVCTTAVTASGIQGMIQDAAGKTGTTVAANGVAGSISATACHDSAGAWAAEAPLKSVTTGGPWYFCVDSTGASKQTTTALGAAATVCS